MDKKLTEAIAKLSTPQTNNEDKVEKVLKEITTNPSAKKYLLRLINLVVDYVKNNPIIKRDNTTQVEILVQLKLLNDNIQDLNTNLLDFIEKDGKTGEND